MRRIRRAAPLLSLLLLLQARSRAEEPAEPPDFGIANRFSQTSTPLVNDKGLLEAVFTHRFNQPVNQAGGNNLWGLDSGASVGLGLEYVPIRNAAVQVYRSSANGDYELAVKGTVLRPTRKLPLAVGVRAGIDWMTKTSLEKNSGGFGQLLVAASLGEHVTLAAAPTYVSNTPLFTDVWNVPLVLQVRITKSIAAIAEYVPRNRDLSGTVGQWSFAVEKSVFRHKFALWVGNSAATTVDQMMASDFGGGVKESNVRIGFNLVRQFDIGTD